MHTNGVPVAAALALCTLAASARAEPEDVAVAVLGVEANDVPDTVAAALTDALRQRVAATKGFRLVAGKDLVEVKLVFSCPDEAPSCMSQVAKSLGAAKLLFGSIKSSAAGEYMVKLKLLDADRSTIENWIAEPLPAKQASSAAMRGLAQKWFSDLTGQRAGGILRVRCNVAGATVSVDGTSIATTARDDVVVTDVPPGKHQIHIEKPGYRAFEQEVDLAAGSTLQVPAELLEGAGPALVAAPAVARSSDGKRALRTGFWITLGAGLASAGAAIKFGNDVLNVNHELDQYRRFPCPPGVTSPSGCNNNQPAKPLTDMDKQAIADKRDEGSRAQTLQWVFIGVGGAFGIASAYLFYRGYLDTGGTSGERTAAHGLRVFPAVGGTTNGVLAEFDF